MDLFNGAPERRCAILLEDERVKMKGEGRELTRASNPNSFRRYCHPLRASRRQAGNAESSVRDFR